MPFHDDRFLRLAGAALLAIGALQRLPALTADSRLEVSVDDYGASPTSGADSTTAIQAAIDAARAAHAAVSFSAGTYLVTSPLNFTNGPEGWSVHGAGKGTTVIRARLAVAKPVMEFTGTHLMRISDFQLLGDAAGSQQVGMLFARTYVNGAWTNLGDNAWIENVAVDLSANPAAVAAVVTMNADLMTFTRSDFSGPTALVIGGQAAAAVASAFGIAFGPCNQGSNTLHSVNDCTLTATVGEGISYAAGNGVTIRSSLFVLGGNASAAVRIVGPGGNGNRILWYNSRLDGVQTTAANSYLLDATTTGSMAGSIEGACLVKGGGPCINFRSGCVMENYMIRILPGPGATLFGGGGSLKGSLLFNPQGLALVAGPSASKNTIIGPN